MDAHTSGASANGFKTRIRPFPVVIVLLPLFGTLGCQDMAQVTDVTDVNEGSEREGGAASPWIVEAAGPILMSSADTLSCMSGDVPECEVVDEPALGGEACVCQLGGLDVTVEVNPDNPPDDQPPDWPDPPGWYPPLETGGGEPGSGDDGSTDCDWGCPIDVEVSLACSTAIQWGATGTCRVIVDPVEQLEHVYRWVFETDEGMRSIQDPAGSDQWSGKMVASGEVRVVIRVGGSDMVVASRILVNRRSWSWDSSKRSFMTGSPGDLDNCFTVGPGLTADVYGCTASNPGILMNPGPSQGFTISPVGDSGPNSDLWFVTNPTTRMDLRTQLARKYRPDATTYPVNGVSQVVQGCASAYSPNPVPPQNNHGINTTCFQTADFSNLVSFTWSHEGQHLSLAQQEAQQAHNDIYAIWEPIVGETQNAAFTLANIEQNAFHDRIKTQALSIHTNDTTYYSMYRHQGSGIWQWETFGVVH